MNAARRSTTILLAGVAAASLHGSASAQGGSGASPGREILVLGFEAGKLPDIVQPVRGSMEVVDRNGTPMLRAASPAEFVLQLPEVLPKEFTLEFEVVPKQCCNPDLTFEGGSSINQGNASAHILWDADGAIQVIGGGAQPFSMQMPASLASPGVLTHVAMAFQGDGTMRLYTSGQRNFTLADRRFTRAKALRVSLGGEDEERKAVYLARIRVSEGAATGTLIAQRAAAVGAEPATAIPATSPTTTQPANATPLTVLPVNTTTTATATPIRVLPEARTIALGPVSATGGGMVPAARNVALAGVAATGTPSVPAPRTIDLAAVTAAGPVIIVTAPTRAVESGLPGTGGGSTVPAARTIALPAVTGTGEPGVPRPRTVELQGWTAAGFVLPRPRTIELTGWTATGPGGIP